MSFVSTSYASQALGKHVPQVQLTDQPQQIEAMPFKIGFEFQESSSLCLWARNQNNLKKKPIFSIFHDDRPLFHIEIDDTDLEFVTRPFSPTERNELALTMNVIIESLDLLKRELNSKDEISFGEWIKRIKEGIGYYKVSLTIEENIDLSQLGVIRIPERFLHKQVDDSSEMALSVHKPRNWNPFFTPQVTIQHPLEETIPLYFSLFGFDSPLLINLVSSLPLLGGYKEILQQNNSQKLEYVTSILRQKIIGLIFLHALTLLSLTPNSDLYETFKTPEERDKNELKEMEKAWRDSMQVDPKMQLLFMSRRPFSEMFRDLDSHSYRKQFELAMGDNFRFMRVERVPERFKLTNYGTNVLTLQGGYAQFNFDQYKIGFKPKFAEDNRDKLKYLLREGIVSTTMLRNLIDDVPVNLRSFPVNSIFGDYYNQAIDSVESPKEAFTYRVSPELGVYRLQSRFDVLSPPWLLDDKYAMGAIKTLDESDLVFGEAITEVRRISRVSPWFLRKIKQPEDLTGDFLRKPNYDMVEQVLGLFDYLLTFRSFDNMHDITYLGLPYAVLKN